MRLVEAPMETHTHTHRKTCSACLLLLFYVQVESTLQDFCGRLLTRAPWKGGKKREKQCNAHMLSPQVTGIKKKKEEEGDIYLRHWVRGKKKQRQEARRHLHGHIKTRTTEQLACDPATELRKSNRVLSS